ncbi:MAG: CBS domain-containing protein [Gemmatimonadetes bacterium]|nr:CBS domain-containing protein [Gemmatimonadota bacterium]
MARRALTDLLVDPGTLRPAAEESLDDYLARLAQRPMAKPRPIRVSPHAVLVDLGPEAGEPGIAYLGPIPRGTGAKPVRAWACLGLGRAAVNLTLAPLLARLDPALGEDEEPEVSDDIQVAKALSGHHITDPVLVEEAVTPLSYRIYPDTPVGEVAQLMIRRGVRAVPVVGQDLEVLGVITGGDLLPHAVPGNGENEAGDRITARDVMTRSVLCVSEEQTLLEASRAMIGRDVGQLPVVREGEMIGFLDRVTVMKAFAEVVDMAPPRSGG